MTTEQKYLEVLKALGELIAKKDDEIICLKYQVEKLEKQLKQAETKSSEETAECKTK